MIEPMLCTGILPDEMEQYPFERYARELKFDGFRLSCEVVDGRVVFVAGRNGADYSGHLPVLEETLLGMLPDRTIIDCEIVAKDGWGSVASAMGTKAVHEADDLELIVFDVIQLNGQMLATYPNGIGMKWEERRKLVETIKVDDKRVQASPLLGPHDTLTAAIDNGFEGIVLKKRDSRYTPGKGRSWLKVKPQQTCVATVVDFKPGKPDGGFAGMVGAFIVKLESGVQTTVKCGPNDRHQEATDHPELWLGRKIELKHHGLDPKSGKVRHPQVGRVRLDREAPPVRVKPARETTTYRMRNYKQMKTPNLTKAVDELRAQAGSAFDKVVSRGGDPVTDLEVAQKELTTREAS